MALALLSYHWEYHGRRFTKPLRYIAERAGVSIGTAQIATRQLEAAGFFKVAHNYRYSETQGGVVRAANSYSLTAKQGYYTLIPYATLRSVLATHMTHAAFMVWIYMVYRQGQQNSHAWASLRFPAKDLDLSKATVCRAVRRLDGSWMIRSHCHNNRNCFSCNNYYVIVKVAGWSSNHCYNHTILQPDLQESGVVSFLIYPQQNTITMDIYQEGKRYESISTVRFEYDIAF